MIITNPFNTTSIAQSDVNRISRGWWALLFIGIISVVAGGIILFVDWTVEDLAAFVGALLLVRGIFTMFSVPVDGAVRSWAIIVGLLEAAVGLAVWVWPGPTLLVIAFAIGWFVLFSGIMTIAGSISGRGILPYWGLMLAFGILETALSFWLLARPGLTLVAAVLAIGLWTLVYGVVLIVLAFEVKAMPARMRGAGRDNGVSSSRPLEGAMS